MKFEDLICTFKEQSYGEDSLICETGICMKCDKGEWHAILPQSEYPTNPAERHSA
jgi:hypothetical protein